MPDPANDAASFADLALSPGVRAAVAAMGIVTPTPIQARAIPVLLAGRDVVAQARTGSGKTLAFALPIVEGCDPSTRGVQALVLVPTRELAIQVGEVMRPLAAARRLKLTLLYGGRSLGPERQLLMTGAQIVVATPGRTLDHLRQRNLSLEFLRIFVLDEADEMLDRGFAPDVERILGFAPTDRQTALLSATVPDWVLGTAARHLREPFMVRVDQGIEAPPEIEHVVHELPAELKLDALRDLLDRRGDGPALVFGRTKHGVKKLAKKLQDMGYPADALQGNLSQNARERVMAGFRSGEVPILVATNVAARGIDVTGIEAVINFEVPESAELFTHRAGRTGRMGRQGTAITLVSPDETKKMREIERVLGKQLPRVHLEVVPRPDTPSMRPDPAPSGSGRFGTRSGGERRSSNGRAAQPPRARRAERDGGQSFGRASEPRERNDDRAPRRDGRPADTQTERRDASPRDRVVRDAPRSAPSGGSGDTGPAGGSRAPKSWWRRGRPQGSTPRPAGRS